jgi:hypothetical protein
MMINYFIFHVPKSKHILQPNIIFILITTQYINLQVILLLFLQFIYQIIYLNITFINF